jgi:hypothetical protein
MTSLESAGAATAETVNGPWKADRLGRQIDFLAPSSLAIFQALGVTAARRCFRTHLVAAGWGVIRRSDGQRKSVPVFRKTAVPTFRADARR